jgi:hypothetical protein
MNRRQFWLIDNGWPKGTPNWVFLGKAVLCVGRMLYPDKWRDDDPSRGLNADEWQDDLSFKLREMNRDAAKAATRKAALDSNSRARSVFTRIAEDCRSGVLESGVRPVPGGEITPLPASVWATEYHRLKDRFVYCQMRIDDPFAFGVGGIGPAKEKGMGYIFIGRPGFNRITWPTPEAIRAKLFPEGPPPEEELRRDKRYADLMAGVDQDSLVYRAMGLPAEGTKNTSVSRVLVRRPKAVAKSHLAKWYQRRVQAWPPGRQSPSERDDLDAAREQFPNVGRPAIREARRNHAPPEWKKAGAARL